MSNEIRVKGNVARDAEMREAAGGKIALQVAIASNHAYKKSNGEWENEPAVFLDCVQWYPADQKDLVQTLLAVLKKGSKHKITVIGRLRTEEWQANDGSKRSKTRLLVTDLLLPPSILKAAPKSGNDFPPESDDDIPF